MKSTFLGLAILFGTTTLASPHRHLHNHAARHARHVERGDAPPASIVTEWVSVVKTIEVTATVWMTPSEPEPTPGMENNKPAPADAVPIPSSSLSAISEPVQTTIPENHSVKESQSITQEIPSAPLQDNSIVSPPIQPSPALDNNAPISENNLAEAAPSPEEVSSASNQTEIQSQSVNAAKCSSAAPCDGDITYYDPGVGLGACGWMSTAAEPVVALPHEFMGAKSNGNPYCGKSITIEHNGKKSTAKVVDKCMGCKGYSIDLSNSVFSQLEELTVGRTTARWYIN